MRASSSVAVVLTCLLGCAPSTHEVNRPSATAAQGSSAVAEQLQRISGAVASAGEEHTIAVLDFRDLERQTNNLSRYLSELFTTDLVRALGEGGRVVERRHADAVAEELRLAQRNLTASDINEFARLLGADAVVIGSYTVIGSELTLNVRLVTVPDGRVLVADVMTIGASADLLALESAGRDTPGLIPQSTRVVARPPAAPVGQPIAQPVAPPPPATRAPESTGGAVIMRITGCRSAPSAVVCRFTVTSTSGDRQVELAVSDLYAPFSVNQGSSLVTDRGTRHKPQSIRLGDETRRDMARGVALEGVNTEGEIRFESVPSFSRIARLEIVGNVLEEGGSGSTDVSFRFRDVPLGQ